MARRVSCGVLEIQISFDMLPLLSARSGGRPARQIREGSYIPLPEHREGLGQRESLGQRRVIHGEESSEILCAEMPAQQRNHRWDRYMCGLAFQGCLNAKSR